MRRFRLFVLIGCVLAGSAMSAAGQTLEIHVINVGQGDATLIRSPSGQSLLIDGGANGQGNRTVVPLLRGLAMTSLTYIVASHYDADHIGGLDEVINAGFRPLVAYDRGTFSSVPTTQSYAGWVNAAGAQRQTIAVGTVIDLGAGVTVECVGVNGMSQGYGAVNLQGAPQFENAASVVLVLRYLDFEMVVAGDLTGGGNGTLDVETTMARAVGDVDVARLSHHGSNTSSNETWFYATAPEVTLISVGLNNPFNHPHLEILQRVQIYPTVQATYQTTAGTGRPGGIWANGTIRIRTDGSSYTVDGGQLTATTYQVDERASPSPHPTRAGELVVSEFMANPSRVNDANGEYFEVRNTTNRRLDLIGITLRDDDFDSVTIASSVPIDPAGSIVICRDGNPQTNGGIVVDYVVSSFFLANAVDEIVIEDPWGNELDGVRYTSSTYSTAAGQAAERIDPTQPATPQNFGAATTTFGVGDRGTPGNPNALDPRFASHVAIDAGFPAPGNTVGLRFRGPAGLDYVFSVSTTRASTPLPGNVTLGIGLDLLVFSFVYPGWIGNLGAGAVNTTLAIPSVPALSGQVFYGQLTVIGPGNVPASASDVVRIRLE